MTNYTKSTNFATKDTLTSGDPLKIVKGTEINTEFDNIQTAVNSKADTASPTFTTPVLGVATATSINKVTITAPATSATLTVADGSTLATSGAYSLTLTSSAATNVTLPTTGTLATLAGSEAFTNKTLTNPTVTNYVESVVAIGNSGTSQTLALTNGTVQTVTMTGNCTFTMPTATAGKSFVLIVSTGAGGFTGTFTSVKWPNNGAPTLTTTASRWDILTFFADGTNWYGTFAQAFQ
jgi:hypothetical protein